MRFKDSCDWPHRYDLPDASQPRTLRARHSFSQLPRAVAVVGTCMSGTHCMRYHQAFEPLVALGDEYVALTLFHLISLRTDGVQQNLLLLLQDSTETYYTPYGLSSR